MMAPGPIAQWQSSRLITGQVLVRVQVGPPSRRRSRPRPGTAAPAWARPRAARNGSRVGPGRTSGSPASDTDRAASARHPHRRPGGRGGPAPAGDRGDPGRADERERPWRPSGRARHHPQGPAGEGEGPRGHPQAGQGEARLYEVKTNKEYSAVLIEIEEIKQEKAEIEDEILALMERQDRLAGEIREAEARLKAPSPAAHRGGRAAHQAHRGRGGAGRCARRPERRAPRRCPRPSSATTNTSCGPRRAGGGYGEARAICCGCRVTIRPQAIQELQQRTPSALRELRPLPLLAA